VLRPGKKPKKATTQMPLIKKDLLIIDKCGIIVINENSIEGILH
jgi:hypothetical protein